MADEKDQPTAKAEDKEPTNLQEYMDSGFDKFDAAVAEEESKAKEETKPEVKPEVKAAEEKKDEPCDDCPGGKNDKSKATEKEETREPYKVLKVQGKDVPVYSEEELIELAQKGTDYTRKTQALANDRKQFELDATGKASKLNELSAQIEGRLKGKPETRIEPTLTEAEQKANVYKDFDIDELDDDPTTKKLVDRIVEQGQQQKTSDNRMTKIEDGLNLIALKEEVDKITTSSKKAMEEFPLVENIDDSGFNHTEKQYREILESKLRNPNNKGRQSADLARETIREIHLMQKGEGVKPEPTITEKTTPDDFAKSNPALYKQILEQGKTTGVVEHLEETNDLPPGLNKSGAEVDTKKVRKEKEPETLDEILDKGFNRWDKAQEEELAT